MEKEGQGEGVLEKARGSMVGNDQLPIGKTHSERRDGSEGDRMDTQWAAGKGLGETKNRGKKVFNQQTSLWKSMEAPCITAAPQRSHHPIACSPLPPRYQVWYLSKAQCCTYTRPPYPALQSQDEGMWELDVGCVLPGVLDSLRVRGILTLRHAY